jgi:hypothetical protein
VQLPALLLQLRSAVFEKHVVQMPVERAACHNHGVFSPISATVAFFSGFSALYLSNSSGACRIG